MKRERRSGLENSLEAAVLAGMVLLLLAPEVLANGFRNPPSSASALGHVGAQYALTEDVSAQAINPATLTSTERPAAMAALNFLRAEVEFRSPLNQTANTVSPWKVLPNVFVAAPVQDWVLGLAVTTPFGQSTEWERGGAFEASAPYFASMTVINFNPGVARKLADGLSVGAGVNVFWSELEMRMNTAGLGIPGKARFHGDGTGLGGNLGLRWRLAPGQWVSLAYRTAVTVEYDGDFESSAMPALKSDFETEIEFPDIVGLGYGVQVSPDLRLGVDLEWLRFSRFEELRLDIGAPAGPALPPAMTTIPEQWDDTWSAGAGAEWKFAADWLFRAGYFYMASPIPEETLAPTLPDGDQHVVSTGVGFHRGAHALDVAYAIGLNEDRHVNRNANPAYVGSYEIKPSHMLQLAYRFSF